MDRSTLNKATSADDTPTPGYLYTEIAKATFSAPDASQQLADYLLKKLERDNPHVKLKVLRIVKHVCEQGKPDFRRAVQKKADVIKSCLQYRGTPDPLKGDAPNKMVRDEADAAVKAVFSSDSSTNAYGMSMDAGRKMQGFGSESGGPEDFSSRIGGISGQNFGGGGGGSSFGSHQMGSGGMGSQKAYGGGGGGGGGGMVGFGNPNFDNNAPKEQENTYLKQAMGTTWSAMSTLASKVPGMSSAMPAPTPEPSTSTYRAPPIGGGGGGGGGGYGGDSGGGFGSGMKGRWGNDMGGGGGGYGGGGAPRPTTSSGTGEYESRVVGELCAPGGPRVAPSASALEEFARKCESLDASAVGDQLRQKLGATGDQSWQTRLKALHAVEALHSHGLDGIVGHVSQFSSELLFECQEMPQCRQKASKVLHLLGFIDQVEDKAAGRSRQESGAVPTAAAPAAPAMDLLDMDDGPPAAPSAPSGMLDGYQAPAAAAGSMDLLETAAPAAATNGTASLLGGGGGGGDMLDFGGGGAAPASAPMPADSPGGSLFGGLSVAGQPAAPSPAPAAAPSLLAGLEQPAQDQGIGGGGAGGGGSLFSNMNLGGTGAAAQAPAAASQAAPAVPSAMPGGQMPFGMGAAAGTPQQPAAGGSASVPGGTGGMPAAIQAAQAGVNRTAHLNVLAGGGMGPGPNPMQMQGMQPMQGMGPGMGGGMQMPGMQGMQPMQGGMGAMQSMQPMQPMQQMQPGGMGMGAMGQQMGGMPPQGFQGQPGMGGAPMGTGPAPVYGMPGGTMPPPMGATGGVYGMPGQAPYTAPSGPAFGGGGGGPSQGGGSAFGFISGGGAAAPAPQGPMPGMEGGGCGAMMGGGCGAMMGGLTAEQPKQDSAFSFVADEMKGARG